MSAITEEDPPSPCVGVCTLDATTQLCQGCFRNLTEIAGWMYCSPQQKREVLARLEERCEGILNGTYSAMRTAG